MNKASRWTALLLVIGLTACACATTYLFWFSSKEFKLGILTALVSLIGLIYTQNRNSQRDIQARQFSQKAEVYQRIIVTISGIFKETKGWAKPKQGDQLAKQLFDIQTELLVWAGPDVLKAWQLMKDTSEGPGRTLANAQKLLAALRRELGHTHDDQLGPLGLVKIYVHATGHEEIDQLAKTLDL